MNQEFMEYEPVNRQFTLLNGREKMRITVRKA
jgi:hypothetical protein